MDSLATLTYDTFRSRLGETFRDRELAVAFELVEVTDLSEVAQNVPEGQRTPFSLVFRAPAEPALSQGIRPLAHDELGELDLFVVPIAREADGMRYQAVFS